MTTTDMAKNRATAALVPILREASDLDITEATLAAGALVAEILKAGLVIREQLSDVKQVAPPSPETAPEHIIQFFSFAHLPPNLQEISRPFSEMASRLLELPRNSERTVALRKLLESKDAAVRAYIAK